MMAAPQPPPEHAMSCELHEPTCPWCVHTGGLKQVLMHMESQHHRQWGDLTHYLPVAGGAP
jgi:hypothetical protein